MKKIVCMLLTVLLCVFVALPVCAAKQDPVLTIAPKADDAHLSYDENACPLVTPGEATGGKLVYSLTGNQDDFSEVIPTTNDLNGPGSYAVYYKIIGDENHNDTPVDFLTVSVGTPLLTAPLSEEESDALTREWGVKRRKTASDGNTYTYWVSDDGTTSAIVTDDDIIWLYEESVDHFDAAGNPVYVSCWYGLSNPRSVDGTRLFKEGSRFSVSMLRPFSDKWNPLWNNIDPSSRTRLDPETLSIIDLRVTDPDGNERRALNDLAMVYIQHNDDLSLTMAENVAYIEKALPLNGLPAPEAGRYAVLLLDHFGDDFIVGTSGVSAAGSAIAGNKTTPILSVCIIAVVSAAAITTVVLVKKKKVNQKAA